MAPASAAGVLLLPRGSTGTGWEAESWSPARPERRRARRPARRERIVRVAGALLSALGHAGLLGLAAIGPPFLWAPKDHPVPVVSVTLLTVAELADMVPAPPPVPAAPVPAPIPSAARSVPMPPPLVAAPAEEPTPEETTLAPGFDAGAPLGLAEGAADGGAVFGAQPDLATSLDASPEAGIDVETLRLDYAARVQKAVDRARVYPRVARDRGLEGRVLFQVVLSPDGRLLASQLLQSSGAMTLDRAALETVRKARFPAAPAGIEEERQTFAVEVVFRGSKR